MAEWSKALVSGTSQKWRGFEPHYCQIFFCTNLSWNCPLETVALLKSSAVVFARVETTGSMIVLAAKAAPYTELDPGT